MLLFETDPIPFTSLMYLLAILTAILIARHGKNKESAMDESLEVKANATEALLYNKRDGVATLTLNRPAVKNALTTEMFVELERHLIDIEADQEVRVVVLTGTRNSFCAGADLNQESREERRRVQGVLFAGDTGGDILERGNRCILRLQKLPKPVLASLGGDAVGIGCSLALAADLRIAADTARMGVVFSKIGLGPDGGASYFLNKLVGSAKALELLFLGDLLSAQGALELGLLSRVVPVQSLAEETAQLAKQLANGPTLAYGLAKAAVYQSDYQPLENILDVEARSQRVISRSHDAKEGIKAFLERRKPDYQGL